MLAASAAFAAAAGLARSAQSAKITKGVLSSMLPKELPLEERFKLAVEVGFPVMEERTVASIDEARAIKNAADKAGLRIHSVMNQAHWGNPISSSDPAEVDASVQGMKDSLEQAKLWGADTVLLVPAVVREDTTYEQAWERSQKVVRERILPLAEKLEVIVAMEEVWNKFLLTPRDFAQYIDEFKHPLVRAYFDVGNVVHYGVPQQWIETLGNRTVKLHLKDYSRGKGFTNLGDSGEGGIDWPAIRRSLDKVGYTGVATVELRGGDREYLADVSQRVDRLLEL